jgi:hypothetical protein
VTAAIAAAPAIVDDHADSKTRGKAKTVGGPRVDAFFRYRYALRLLTCLKKEENLTLALLAARADNATGAVEGHTIDAILNGDLPKGAQIEPDHRFTRKQSKSTFLRNLEFFETKMVMQRPDGTVVPAVQRTTKRSAGKVKNDVSSYVIHDDVLAFYLGKPRPREWDPPKKPKAIYSFREAAGQLRLFHEELGRLLETEDPSEREVAIGTVITRMAALVTRKPANDAEAMEAPTETETPPSPPAPASEVVSVSPVAAPTRAPEPVEPEQTTLFADRTLRSRQDPEAMRTAPPANLPTAQSATPAVARDASGQGQPAQGKTIPTPAVASPSSVAPPSEDAALLEVLKSAAQEGHPWCSRVLPRIAMRRWYLADLERVTLREIRDERARADNRSSGPPGPKSHNSQRSPGRQQLDGAEKFFRQPGPKPKDQPPS